MVLRRNGKREGEFKTPWEVEERGKVKERIQPEMAGKSKYRYTVFGIPSAEMILSVAFAPR